jgi:uncharacterized protein (TIGR00269 family)
MEFRRRFEARVRKTIKDFSLCTKKDRIVVACSGGKDSTTILYLLKKFGYDVEALTIDLLIGDWSKKNLENIKEFCRNHKIKLHVVDMRKRFGCSICHIRAGIQENNKLSNCTICGVIKRWILNKEARRLEADKLVTGHNLDDEAENVLMNLFKGNPGLGVNLGPKTGIVSDKKFVQRIKPLYFCTNGEVKIYSKEMKFPVLYESCPCAVSTFRREIRKELSELEKLNPDIKRNIVKNFLFILPKLRRWNHLEKKLNYCEYCGEPCRREVCKRCELLLLMGKNSTIFK